MSLCYITSPVSFKNTQTFWQHPSFSAPSLDSGTVKTLSELSRKLVSKGAEKSEGWRQAGERRRETKLKGRTRQQEENKTSNGKQNNGSAGCSLMETGPFPLRVEAEVRCGLGFERHAPASQAGWWWGGGPTGEQKRKLRVQRQTSSCSGQAQLTGAGRDVLFFQPVRWRGGVRRLCPAPGRGPSKGQPLKGTHTQEWTWRVYVRK